MLNTNDANANILPPYNQIMLISPNSWHLNIIFNETRSLSMNFSGPNLWSRTAMNLNVLTNEILIEIN